MRTLKEISGDITVATALAEASRLVSLAIEASELGTIEGEIQAAMARGAACRLEHVYDHALAQFELALKLCGDIDDQLGAARILQVIANVHDQLGRYSESLVYLQSALEICEQRSAADRDQMTAVILLSLGSHCYDVGSYAEALSHFGKALELFEQLADIHGIAQALANVGNTCTITGAYQESLRHYERAQECYTSVGAQPGIARVIHGKGNVYQYMGSNPEALDHYRHALMLYGATGEKEGIARTTTDIGSVYFDMGEYEQAVECFGKALALHRQLDNRASIAHVTGNIIEVLLKQQDYQRAAELLNEQADMSLVRPAVQAQRSRLIAQVRRHEGDLNGARQALLDALQTSINAGIRSTEADVHMELRDLAQQLNDFPAFIEHNAAYIKTTEEIRGREATQKLAIMEVERKLEEERRERDKERAVLYSTLPPTIADRVVRGEKVVGDSYDVAAVIFLDIVDFTSISDRIPPSHVVHLLSQIFTVLDEICKQHAVTKIKTIGDSYMAVSFPANGGQQSEDGGRGMEDGIAVRAARCAVAMLDALDTLTITMPPELGDTAWTKDVGDIKVRIGLHCGPVTAGVIGTERLQYDVWGDTVNVASRLESTGEPGRIHVSETIQGALHRVMSAKDIEGGSWTLDLRGATELKGKGTMRTYWLNAT